jgi:hypothetical protein
VWVNNAFALQHRGKREWLEILFYRERRKQESKTMETERKILLSHRMFRNQRRKYDGGLMNNE